MLQETSTKRFKAFTTTTKNNIEIHIREATIQDAPDLIRCIRSYIAESPYQVMEPEEFAPDISQGREFINGFLHSDNSILVVATEGERIIGNLDITGGRRKRLRHTGLLGLGMLREFQAQGLGTTLVAAGIEWARANPVLQKLWLQIIADNTPAIALYRKMGFVEEGRQIGFIREAEGQYRDNLIMSMEVGIS